MFDNIENNDITQADNRLFRIYNQIIEEAKTRDFEVKGEEHHIFPKCIFGPNDIVVKLTHEEHFKVHYILWKAYKFKYGERNKRVVKLAHAFTFMNCHNKNYCDRYSPQEAKEYSRLKEAFNENNPWRRPIYDIHLEKYGKEEADRLKAERASKVSMKIVGENHWNYGNHESEETRKKISESVNSFYQSDEFIEKISIQKQETKKRQQEQKEERKRNHIRKPKIWGYLITLEKYGKEEADKREAERKRKEKETKIKNSTYGTSNYERDLKKYGKEEADRLENIRIKHMKQGIKDSNREYKGNYQYNLERLGKEEADRRESERRKKQGMTRRQNNLKKKQLITII